jgi:hypothetical protein
MTSPTQGAGSNPPAGGSGASQTTANPPAGGQPFPTPAQTGTPAGPGAPANPPVGGQAPGQAPSPEADDAPVPRHLFNEVQRSDRAKGKRIEELEKWVQAQKDAQLTDAERKDKIIADYQAKEADWQIREQNDRLLKAVDAVREKYQLADSEDTMTLLRKYFGERIDYDETGRPENIDFLVGQLVEQKPHLKRFESTPQPPSSGRIASPSRNAATGRYTPAPPPPQPRKLGPGDSLSTIDWSQPTPRSGQG